MRGLICLLVGHRWISWVVGTFAGAEMPGIGYIQPRTFYDNLCTRCGTRRELTVQLGHLS